MAQITIRVINAKGDILAQRTAENRVSLVHAEQYEAGDTIVLETDQPGLHCVVQLEDTMPSSLVYIKGCRMEFHIPPADNRMNYNPRSFTKERHLISGRIASEKEISSRRNLAFNPYDAHGDNGFYPHAKANVETRGEMVFAARNAIDGMYENDSHGEWPYQSWGINRDPNAAMTLDFGRLVRIDELRLTLRADFPHDSWWTQATVRFGDGSREILRLRKTANPQCFPIQPRIVDRLELCELIKAEDESPFPALTQLEAWGTEAKENTNT